MMQKLFFVFCACLLLTGCAVKSKSVVGMDFDETKVESIIKKKSTKDDVLKLYGQPTDKALDEKYNEQWIYSFTEGQSSVNLWTSNAKGTSRLKKLIIVFDQEGVVQNFVFSDNTTPVSASY